MFKVDVITPVFNNALFIRKCVESAHVEPEVNRIIVVDDGSTDGTLALLRELSNEFPKLTILTHEGGRNRGIACSRNLGLHHSTAEWIAFLDSDDFYMPNRFRSTAEVIAENPGVDGVYEPVVNQVVSEEGAKRFLSTHADGIDGLVITIQHGLAPRQVFDAMYFGWGGVVHLNGLTLRREFAREIGFFDENLRIVDDSIFRLKAAYKGLLAEGSQMPVAVRTIHGTNNEPNINPYDRFKKYDVLLDYLIAWRASVALKRSLVKRALYNYIRYKGARSRAAKAWAAVSFVVVHPRMVFNYLW